MPEQSIALNDLTPSGPSRTRQPPTAESGDPHLQLSKLLLNSHRQILPLCQDDPSDTAKSLRNVCSKEPRPSQTKCLLLDIPAEEVNSWYRSRHASTANPDHREDLEQSWWAWKYTRHRSDDTPPWKMTAADREARSELSRLCEVDETADALRQFRSVLTSKKAADIYTNDPGHLVCNTIDSLAKNLVPSSSKVAVLRGCVKTTLANWSLPESEVQQVLGVDVVRRLGKLWNSVIALEHDRYASNRGSIHTIAPAPPALGLLSQLVPRPWRSSAEGPSASHSDRSCRGGDE